MNFYRNHHFHAALIKPGRETLPVELHWDTQPRLSLSKIPEEEFWRNARAIQVGDLKVHVPGREENFVYLVAHLSRHTLGLDRTHIKDIVAMFLDPAIRCRLIWLTDLVLLARGQNGLDWRKIRRLATRWGLRRDVLAAIGLIRLLESTGTVNEGDATTSSTEPAKHLNWARTVATRFPGFARTSSALQFRPVLVFEILRLAFPGTFWIRSRYGLRESGRTRVLIQAVRHAMEMLWGLIGTSGAALMGYAFRIASGGGGRRLRSENLPKRVPFFTPLGKDKTASKSLSSDTSTR